MHAVFLGHNGFALGDPDSPVLVDPILHARYGDEYTSSPVEIYPPRQIERALMPDPSAVLLTHEHSDHFHLPSLDLLCRDTRILVGPMMIAEVTRLIEVLGFTVERLEYREPISVGGIDLELFPPGEETVLWESRVSQVWAREQGSEGGGLYLCVDATISSDLPEEVAGSRSPSVIALSNNSQISPPGVFGSLGNLHEAASVPRHPGMDILAELVRDTVLENPGIAPVDVIICGGGFLKDYEQLGPFPFSDQDALAATARRLTRNMDVLGPLPGDIIEIDEHGAKVSGQANWIRVDGPRRDELRRRRTQFVESGAEIPMRNICPSEGAHDDKQALDTIEVELAYLARALLLSSLGGRLIVAARHFDMSHPFAIGLRFDHIDDVALGLSVSRGRFEAVPWNGDDAQLRARHPFGILIHGADLAAVMEGQIQIWDVVGIGMRAWYIGEALESPVAVLYDAFGEQVRPDLACAAYRKQVLTLVGDGSHK